MPAASRRSRSRTSRASSWSRSLRSRSGAAGRGDPEKLHTVKQEVTAAISKSHGLRAADLVLVPPGSIPITTSGKIRRSTCAERYRRDEFTRVDVIQ